MKLSFQLAYKNLIGAGLRTWLNVAVLSFAFVIIIFFNGVIDGWNQQARIEGVKWEYGHGQLLNENYDPFDPFSMQDGHDVFPKEAAGNLTPILIRQATIYPEGRMVSVVLKGIDADQSVLELPTKLLQASDAEIPCIIGKRMAASANLKVGDQVLMRWRDGNGTFDAANITVAGIFDTDVGTVDNGQIWMAIDKLWDMTGLDGHATMFVASEGYEHKLIQGWKFDSQEELLSELSKIIEMKKTSSSIMYVLLLAIALLAIFDTQVLSIFRRQKEIGTYVALGMTRMQVVGLFTVEGSMYSLFAMVVGCLYGIPFFIYMANTGIAIPAPTQEMGVTIGERIFPAFGAGLVFGTTLLVVISATIVSFLPTRRIAKMDPVTALKGKLI
ncbi:MAG: FtsX-like permease family protein [Imperialibacter sp.]|uniref:ABC transporter permease n=1 Tax=Imperialibacter sp. TaxID=2038411 RepID=UPI0032EFE00E